LIAVASTHQSRLGGRSAQVAAAIIAFVVAFCFLGPLLSYKPQQLTGEGNVFRQLCYICAFFCAMLAAGALSRPARLLAIPLPIVAAIFWCLASLTWAVAPSIGARRLILTITIIWTIFLAVNEAGLARTMSTLRIVLVGALVVNYAAVVLAPSMSIHHAVEIGDPGLVGDWRGVMGHKNFAGPTCGFTILYFVFGAQRMKLAWRAVILLAAALFLYKSGSKTSIGLTGITLIAGGLFSFYDARVRGLILPLLIGTVALAVLLGLQLVPELLTMLSRPDALTGRGQIWPVLLAFVRDHPLTGSGFGSFWNIGPDSPAFDYGRGWVVAMAQGHNGYLDILVTVGVPGLILVVFATLIVPFGKLLSSQTIDNDVARLLFASMLFCAGHNFTESTIFDRDLIVEVFLMITIALIYLATRRSASSEV
jgi:O-antigen ligase